MLTKKNLNAVKHFLSKEFRFDVMSYRKRGGPAAERYLKSFMALHLNVNSRESKAHYQSFNSIF